MEQKEKNEPKINIFNEDISSWKNEENKKVEKVEKAEEKKHNKCSHDSKHCGGGIWGLIILFVGVLLLMNNFGIISRDIWIFMAPFWPIILILIGIKIILGRSRIASFFSFIIALILLGLVFFCALMRLENRSVMDMYRVGHFNNFYIIDR